jgi:hypothetical protein
MRVASKLDEAKTLIESHVPRVCSPYEILADFFSVIG